MSKRKKERTQAQVIDESLIKMQKYLERKGIASSRVELERKTIIQIAGIDKNGGERLIVPELREKYGSDNLELDDSFQILMPFILQGTIIMNLGKIKHYEEYEVYDETDTKFSLKINDYIKMGKVFALMLKIDVQSISKIAPIYTYSYKCENVMDFFIEPYKGTVDINFSDYEKNAIIEPLMADSQEYNVVATICNVIAVFRAMNFLKKTYSTCGHVGKIYSNEYYNINNWNGKVNELCLKNVQSSQKEELLKELMTKMNYSTVIPKNQTVYIIKELIKRDEINIFLSAVGFVYESGLRIIENELKLIAQRNNSDIEMIIGALQHFDCKNPDTKIDRTTVKKINEMMDNLGVKVYTYQPSFYHGKYYYLQNGTRGYVIVGSSNISNTAFNKNYELDIIHTFNPKMNNSFANWFFQLRNGSKEIIELEEGKFMQNHWESEQDAFVHISKNRISLEDMHNEINKLTDDDKKFRLNLWMEHMPAYIYNNVSVNALQNYIMLVFTYNHLVVFESFIPGNAYYVFKYDDLDSLVEKISQMTKSQMILAEYSIQRGNHIQNKDNLKRKIDKLFM